MRVAPIKAALEAAGIAVWWDAMLEPGTAFARKTEQALESADAVIVAWSKISILSHWVRDEATWGREHSRLVPLSLDGAEPPLGFRQYQVVDLSGWRGKADDLQLEQVINAVRGGPSAPYIAPREQARVNRRVAIGIGGGGLIALAAGAAAWRGGLISSASAVANSVAVLPFKNLSGDPAQAYFSDGLSEEVRSTLSRNRQLRVLAPTSSNIFRDQSQDAKVMAKKLGVAFLLEGSVRRAGDMVRISAELIDGATGFSSWSDSFDRGMKDIFAVQTEIATTVASALASEVAAAGGGDIGIGGTKSVAAYDAYLRGRAMVAVSGDEPSFRAALAQFDSAIHRDPNYAAAYAQRSRTLTIIANQFAKASEFKQLYGSAIAAARQSIALAPNLADGPSVLGYALFQGELDVRAARAPFDRSRALGDGDGSVMTRFAIYAALTGRFEEADRAMARALELDPLNPLIHRTAGAVHYAARNYDKAIPELQQALTLNPKMWATHAALGDCALQRGRLEEARAAYQAEPQDLVKLPGLAIVERRLGHQAEAEAAMAALTTGLDVGTLYQQAQVLSAWNDPKGALEKLRQARVVGDSGLVYARTDPMLDPLRTNSEFMHLLSGMGFD
jgi:TolB-like protein/tetratricopeptide (TPR) repeat protein